MRTLPAEPGKPWSVPVLPRVMIASIEDLLTMKRIANRPKDQLDIVALEKIKRGEDPNA